MYRVYTSDRRVEDAPDTLYSRVRYRCIGRDVDTADFWYVFFFHLLRARVNLILWAYILYEKKKRNEFAGRVVVCIGSH